MLAAAVSALGDSGVAQRADINDTLRALAHPDGAPLLQYGVVGSEQIGNLALFAGAPEPVVRRASPRATPKQPPNGIEASANDARPSSTKPVAKIDLRALRSLERKAAAAKSGSQRADAALGAARTALAAAKEAVAAATTAAAQARADAREAVAAVDQLRDQAR